MIFEISVPSTTKEFHINLEEVTFRIVIIEGLMFDDCAMVYVDDDLGTDRSKFFHREFDTSKFSFDWFAYFGDTKYKLTFHENSLVGCWMIRVDKM